jgi:hypothetical protein
MRSWQTEPEMLSLVSHAQIWWYQHSEHHQGCTSALCASMWACMLAMAASSCACSCRLAGSVLSCQLARGVYQACHSPDVSRVQSQATASRLYICTCWLRSQARISFSRLRSASDVPCTRPRQYPAVNAASPMHLHEGGITREALLQLLPAMHRHAAPISSCTYIQQNRPKGTPLRLIPQPVLETAGMHSVCHCAMSVQCLQQAHQPADTKPDSSLMDCEPFPGLAADAMARRSDETPPPVSRCAIELPGCFPDFAGELLQCIVS